MDIPKEMILSDAIVASVELGVIFISMEMAKKAKEQVILNCLTCNKISQSQSNLPPVDPLIPDYPFQHICFDCLIQFLQSYSIYHCISSVANPHNCHAKMAWQSSNENTTGKCESLWDTELGYV